MIFGSSIIHKAYLATRRQIGVSVLYLAVITSILAIILWLSERQVQPHFSFWDAFIWPYEKYIGDPGKIVDEPLMSPIGKIIGTLVGILGVAIFAVPAGLVGSGLIDAMNEEKRKAEIEEYHQRMKKAFHRSVNKTLQNYLNTQLNSGSKKYRSLHFVPSYVPVSRMHIRQGIDPKNIIAVCENYPDFRMKDLTEAMGRERLTDEYYVIEHYIVNRPYGCCISRHSKVTIVATNSYLENSTGWFAYYLAKLGGFNYVSKEIEVDPDEPDSFYSFIDEPLYNKKRKVFYERRKDKKALEILTKKDINRQAFLDDLKLLAKGEDSWVIVIRDHTKSPSNHDDFHFSDSCKDGGASTVHDQECYHQMLKEFDQIMKEEYQLTSSFQSQQFPLPKNHLGYRLLREQLGCNSFVLRLSTDIINFHDSRLLLAFRIGKLFCDLFDHAKGIEEEDVVDFDGNGFGYQFDDYRINYKLSSIGKSDT